MDNLNKYYFTTKSSSSHKLGEKFTIVSNLSGKEETYEGVVEDCTYNYTDKLYDVTIRLNRPFSKYIYDGVTGAVSAHFSCRYDDNVEVK